MNRFFFPTLRFLCLSAFLLLAHCSNTVLSPSDISSETLLSSPDTLKIDSNTIVLNTFLFRDFEPGGEQNGRPLKSLIYLTTVDSSNLTLSIEFEKIFIINGSEIWSSVFSDKKSSIQKPFEIDAIAENGPKWEPEIYVDVIVNFKIGSKKYQIKAIDQFIYKEN